MNYEPPEITAGKPLVILQDRRIKLAHGYIQVEADNPKAYVWISGERYTPDELEELSRAALAAREMLLAMESEATQ